MFETEENKMKKALRRLSICVAVVIIAALLSLPAFAANDYSNEDIAANAANAEISGNSETTENSESQPSNASSESGVLSAKAIAAAIAISLAAAGGAVGMGIAIAKSADGISRQPEASGNIRTSLMLGLVFIETAIIYALIVAILIIFVL